VPENGAALNARAEEASISHERVSMPAVVDATAEVDADATKASEYKNIIRMVRIDVLPLDSKRGRRIWSAPTPVEERS